MALGLSIYRSTTSIVGSLLGGLLARAGSAGGVWRAGFVGATPEALRGAGSIWVHGASIGEVGMAGTWIEALVGGGASTPILLTTRTAAGLARARAELGDRVAASIAPHDVPGTVATRFDAARPRRLDLIETELWPNMIVEARRRSVPVVLVSATVSARTVGRLRRFGLSGRDLFGEGVYALPQSEAHAARFLALGVDRDRIRVIGDLKAKRLDHGAERTSPFGSRPALIFGSFRPGEEDAARRLAELLEARRDREDSALAERSARRSIAPSFEGRSRAVLVIAPRHREGEERVRATFRATPFEVSERRDESRGAGSVGAWIDEISRRPGPRIGLLATRGELATAYEHAWGVVIGGTFAGYGGHNVWEPAARGCPVIIGPHGENVAVAAESVTRAGGGEVARKGAAEAATIVERWISDPELERVGAAAERAVAEASGAAQRGLDALDAWRVVR